MCYALEDNQKNGMVGDSTAIAESDHYFWRGFSVILFYKIEL